MSGEVTATLSALRNRGCHVSQEWLTECINFFRSENNQYTLRDLETFVYDQWLLADLRDFGLGSFPPNLKDNLKITIQGKMACQVEQVIDIGHSLYSQMQKVRKEDVGNLQVDENGKEFQQAWEPKSNRMLELTLCDGVQTFKAIEYRSIPSLKADLIPGTKLLIKGPVLCRRGLLMLEEKHLAILGGEVESLVISNAYENVLARKLQLPENPDPYKLASVENDLPSVKQSTSQRPPPANVQHSSHQNVPPNPSNQPVEFCGSDEDFLNIPLNDVDWETEIELNPPAASNSCQMTTNQNTMDNISCDAEFEMGSDEEAMLLEAEANVAGDTPVTAVSNRPQTYVKETSAKLSSNVSKTAGENSASKRPASCALQDDSLRKPLFAKRRKETSSQEITSTTADLNNFFDDDLLDFEADMPIPNEDQSLDPPLLSAQPFVYLSEMLKTMEYGPDKYRVKAAVITVIEKLSISEERWKLSAKISDGSANVDVRFSNEVLEELIGMSAKTMNDMKRQKKPENREILKKKLEKAQGRLIHLNCLLDIEKETHQALPIIVGMQEISSDTVAAMKRRLNSVKSTDNRM